MLGFAGWFFKKPIQGFLPTRAAQKRVLIIYDLSSQPFAIGDILTFQEASLTLREEKRCSAVDFAFVYDPINPTVPDPVLSTITGDNCIFHLASILPVAQVNPYLGSLFLFNNHEHLERFVADNVERYHVWPSADNYLSKEYLYYHIFNGLLADYYRRNNRIPHLQSRSCMHSWALKFLHEHVFPSVPVTVQLRRNTINPERNSNNNVWREFFTACGDRYPVKFLIICGESEVDERFRDCPNVMIVKDNRTYIEQDLALINCAAIHMGASSGPGMMAIFSSKPYLLINAPLKPLINTGFVQNGDLTRAFFATSVQQISVKEETLDMLTGEFEKMWMSLDMEFWDKTVKQPLNREPDIYSWLR